MGDEPVRESSIHKARRLILTQISIRDPEVFPDFDEFRPERFLDPSGSVDVVPPDTHGMGHVTYGFGRRCVVSVGMIAAPTQCGLHRVCAGYQFANQVLFIHMAMLLWAFDFAPPCGPDGTPVLPSKDECIDAGVVVCVELLLHRTPRLTHMY
jgi:cytochrome P450